MGHTEPVHRPMSIVIPAQAGIQKFTTAWSGIRYRPSSDSGHTRFTVSTRWQLAWVPACAGTTRWRVENLMEVCDRCRVFTKGNAIA